MNKSKFLKKSLAAILSVLLVVAMIPLSAAAVTNREFVPQVFVNGGTKIDYADGVYSAEVSSKGTIRLSWAQPSTNLPTNVRMDVDFIGANGLDLPNDEITNLDTQATSLGNNVYSVTVKSTVWDERPENTGEKKVEDTYTLNLTYVEKAAVNDASIEEVYLPGITADINNSANTIVLHMGFGASLPTTPQNLNTGTTKGIALNGSYGGVSGNESTATVLNDLINWFTPVTNKSAIEAMVWTANVDGTYTLVVDTTMTASKTFKVTQVWDDGFTSFSVPKQVGETRISTNGLTIDIDVPATTSFSKLIIPTFTLDSEQVSVATKSQQGDVPGENIYGTVGSNPSNISMTSGITGLDFNQTISDSTGAISDASTGIVLLNVTNKAGKKTEVKVTLHKLPYDTNELKSVEFVEDSTADPIVPFANSIQTDVNANGVTEVKIQNGTDLTGATADIIVVASSNATVVVDGQNIVADMGAASGTNYNKYTFDDVDVSKGAITIRVTPQDGTPSKEYTIRLVQDIVEGQIRKFYLKDGTSLVGTTNISPTAKQVTVTVPYNKGYFDSANPTKGMGGYDVYMELTAGAVARFPRTDAASTVNLHSGVESILGTVTVGDILKANVTAGTAYNGITLKVPEMTKANNYVVPGTDLYVAVSTPSVTDANGNQKVEHWKIRIQVEKPNQGHTLFNSGNTLVGTNNLGKITANNTYDEVTVGTGTANDGTKINTVKVMVPYSFDNPTGNGTDITELAFKDWNISDGAIIGRKQNGNKNKINVQAKVPTDSYDNLTNGTYLTITATDIASAVGPDGRIDKTKAQVLYVISESACQNDSLGQGVTHRHLTVDADGKLLYDGSAVANDQYTVYYLYCEKKPAERGADLLTISSDTDTNVTARLNPVTKHVEVTVPYSYQSGKTFSLNFTLSKQAVMYAVPNAVHSTAGYADDGTPTLISSLNTGSTTYANVLTLKSDAGSTSTIGRTYFYSTSGHFRAGTSSTQAGSNTVPYVVISGGTATSGGLAVSDGKFVVISEAGTDYTEYPVDFKIDVEQTEAELKSLSAAGASATIGKLDANSKADVTLELPVTAQLTGQTLDLTYSKMATVTVNGFAYSKDRKFDLSKDLTIKVVSEDKSKENIYTLKTTKRASFDDVRTTDWFYSEVMKAVAEGWIKGTSSTTYTPYGDMTRIQFATIIARMDGTGAFDPTDGSDCPFTDVTGTESQAAAKYAQAMGYITGVGNNKFAPNNPITREQAAAILCRVNGVAEESGNTSFADDAKISNWAKGYVKASVTAGYFKGKGNGFDPRGKLTRAEGAAVLVRSYNK